MSYPVRSAACILLESDLDRGQKKSYVSTDQNKGRQERNVCISLGGLRLRPVSPCTVLNHMQKDFDILAELKELAADSLELLKAAIFDKDYQALFDLEVFGSLVGMFELNNMGLSIPSPLLQWLTRLSEHEQSTSKKYSSSSTILTGKKTEHAYQAHFLLHGMTIYTYQRQIKHPYLLKNLLCVHLFVSKMNLFKKAVKESVHDV